MRILAFALLLHALLLQPNPPRPDMVRCWNCGTPNDPIRGSKYCRNCGKVL